MSKRQLVALALLALLVLSPMAAALLRDGPAEGRSMTPFDATKLERHPWPFDAWRAAPPTTDPIGSSSGVDLWSTIWSVQRATVGWLLSVPYTVHEGRMWDYAAVLPAPGNPAVASVTLTVIDPDGTPGGGFDGEVIKQVVSAANGVVYADLREVDEDSHIRLQVHILINNSQGGARSSIVGWRIGDCDVDLWHDPFWDIGRHSSRGDLSLGGGAVYPVAEYFPGGIKGDYYNNRDFTSYQYTRLDPVIDFAWGNGGPTGLGSNTFSIRWAGKLNVAHAERFTFYLRIDDGVRLWVDGQRLIDEWSDHNPTEFLAQVDLGEGLHDIQVDYYENQGGATCELRYSTPTISKRIVPQSALYGVEADNVLLSEPIACPEGQTWELLLLSSYGSTKGGMVVVDVLDPSTGLTLTGLDSIIDNAVNLRGVSSALYPSLQLRARWVDANVTEPPELRDWAVKWVPYRTWRTEFLSTIGIVGSVGLGQGRGFVQQPGMKNHAQVAFAESTDGISTTLSSGIYNAYTGRVGGVVTTNASDVAMADLDGDGILDIIYTFSTPGSPGVSYAGYSGGVRDLPLYAFNHSQGSGDNAVFTNILVVDLDDDDVDEVVLAERTTSGKGRVLLYTRDRLSTGGAPAVLVGDVDGTISEVDIGNFDGDGYRDIAIAVSEGVDAGAFVVWGSSSGFPLLSSRRLLSRPCYALGVADFIDTDWTWDDLVVGCGEVGTPPAYDTINRSNIIFSGDDDRARMGPWLALGGEPAERVEVFKDYSDPGELAIVTVQDGVACHYHPSYRLGPNWTKPGGVSDIAAIPLGPDGVCGIVYAVLEDTGLDPAQYKNVQSWSGWNIYTVYPTDGAVAVTAGSMFGLGTGAFRTDKIDVGDPRFCGGWGNLSYTTLFGGPSPGQEIILRILDGETEQAVWNATSTAGTAAFELTDAIKVKEHPTIILEVLLRNLNASAGLSLREIRVTWLPRTAQPPAVLSIVVDDPVIYRTNATMLRIAVDDEYDLPQDLSLVVQMRPPGSSGWLPIGPGTVSWDGSAYALEFDTTRDFPSGNYSFRARATDTDMMTSVWLEATDLVRVINNPPGVPAISILPASPSTTDELRCVIDVQAFDRDGSSMDYIFAWSRDGVPAPERTGATVPASSTAKGQTWSVEVRAFDGEDLGPAVSANVTVANSAPVPVRPLVPIMMYEDDNPVTVDLGAHFADPDGDAMTFTVTGLRNVIVELDRTSGVARFVLSPEWSGSETAVINVTDGELWTEARLDIEVRAVPDPPVVVSIGGRPAVSGVFDISARQDLMAEFEVVVIDPDSTSFRFSADVLPAWVSVGPLNGTISVLAPNIGIGAHAFNMSVRDDSGEIVFVRVRLTVENVNDPPGTVFINLPKNGKAFQASDTILLQGSCSDPDELWGQALTFTWYTNASAEPLGTGGSVTLPKLSPGDHTIKLEVSDGQYLRSSEVRIRVLNPPPPPPPNGNGGDEPYVGPRTMDTIGPALIAIVLVLLVIVAAIAFVSRQRATRGRGWTPSAEPRGKAMRPTKEYGTPPLKGEAVGIRVEQPMPKGKVSGTPPSEPAEEPMAPMPEGWGLKDVPPPKGDESWDGWEEF